jgi:hypothetical protein
MTKFWIWVLFVSAACYAVPPLSAPPPLQYIGSWPAVPQQQPQGQDVAIARTLINEKCHQCGGENLRIKVEVTDGTKNGKPISIASFEWKCRRCGLKWSRNETLK